MVVVGAFTQGVIMLTVSLLLVLAAFGCVLGAALGRVQLWIAVLLLCVAHLLALLPVR